MTNKQGGSSVEADSVLQAAGKSDEGTYFCPWPSAA